MGLGNGIVNLNNARKITDFPIPFPLAQMVTFMLMIHWCTTTVFCAASVEHGFFAAFLAFIVVFSFWSINYIAVELEMPFGDDPNDLPLKSMQEDYNQSLLGLLHPRSLFPPVDNTRLCDGKVELSTVPCLDAFLWADAELSAAAGDARTGNSSRSSGHHRRSVHLAREGGRVVSHYLRKISVAATEAPVVAGLTHESDKPGRRVAAESAGRMPMHKRNNSTTSLGSKNEERAAKSDSAETRRREAEEMFFVPAAKDISSPERSPTQVSQELTLRSLKDSEPGLPEQSHLSSPLKLDQVMATDGQGKWNVPEERSDPQFLHTELAPSKWTEQSTLQKLEMRLREHGKFERDMLRVMSQMKELMEKRAPNASQNLRTRQPEDTMCLPTPLPEPRLNSRTGMPTSLPHASINVA